MRLYVSVLVLWTLFDSCTCWSLDASLWVHLKFTTLPTRLWQSLQFIYDFIFPSSPTPPVTHSYVSLCFDVSSNVKLLSHPHILSLFFYFLFLHRLVSCKSLFPDSLPILNESHLFSHFLVLSLFTGKEGLKKEVLREQLCVCVQGQIKSNFMICVWILTVYGLKGNKTQNIVVKMLIVISTCSPCMIWIGEHSNNLQEKAQI